MLGGFGGIVNGVAVEEVGEDFAIGLRVIFEEVLGVLGDLRELEFFWLAFLVKDLAELGSEL
jgi:hypothetical protein